ncbi:MAG: hypothetical protein ACRD5Z_14065 [Bryobacteraceae bacterium]
MSARKRLALILTVAAAGTACWHHNPQGASVNNAAATLHVDNRNWQDVEILVLHRGVRSHLGSVNGAAATAIEFPAYLMSDLGEVQLIAHAVGTPYTITTGVIVLKPGTDVRWMLQSDLNRSQISVYSSE